jgi:hypothetical protein
VPGAWTHSFERLRSELKQAKLSFTAAAVGEKRNSNSVGSSATGTSGSSARQSLNGPDERRAKQQKQGASSARPHGSLTFTTSHDAALLDEDSNSNSSRLAFFKRPDEGAPERSHKPRAVHASLQQPQPAAASAEVWAERFAPAASGDLAVHKDKVRELRDWIDLNRRHVEQGSSSGQRVLILRGPPGSGKTAMVKVVAAEARVKLIEYGSGPAVTFAENKWCDTPWVSEVHELVKFLRSTQTFGSSALMALPAGSSGEGSVEPLRVARALSCACSPPPQRFANAALPQSHTHEPKFCPPFRSKFLSSRQA